MEKASTVHSRFIHRALVYAAPVFSTYLYFQVCLHYRNMFDLSPGVVLPLIGTDGQAGKEKQCVFNYEDTFLQPGNVLKS